MFPRKIFKRVIKRSFPNVHGKPTFCVANRYATDVTLELRSSLCWLIIDQYRTDKGHVRIWEGGAK